MSSEPARHEVVAHASRESSHDTTLPAGVMMADCGRSLAANIRLWHARSAGIPPSGGPTLQRWFDPMFPTRGRGIRSGYGRFIRTWRTYEQLPGAEPLALTDSYPCLFDDVAATPYDPHYFHQAAWATERILAESPHEHVDVGSDVIWVGTLSAAVPVAFVDIRPLPVQLAAAADAHGKSARPALSRWVDRLTVLPARRRSTSALDVTATNSHPMARVAHVANSLESSGRVAVFSSRFRLAVRASASTPIEFTAPIRSWSTSRDLHLRRILDGERRLRARNQCATCAKGGTLKYGCGLFWFGRDGE